MEITVTSPQSTIAAARPTAKESSLKQYISQLSKIQKRFNAEGSDWSFLSQPDEVESKVSDLSDMSQRNLYNAIIVLLLALNIDGQYTELLDVYGNLRDHLNKKYITENETGKISEKQKPNFASMTEISDMLYQMKKNILKGKLKTKTNLTPSDKTLLLTYTIFSFLKLNPTRNDMAGMEVISLAKFKNIYQDHPDNQKNYLVGGKTMVLNEYKTKKTNGTIKIELNKELQSIFRMYMKLLDRKVGSVLFVSSTGHPISKNGISQLLLKISNEYMGKSVSTTMMRKIVHSENYGPESKFGKLKKEQEKAAHESGHSVSTQNLVYIKER